MVRSIHTDGSLQEWDAVTNRARRRTQVDLAKGYFTMRLSRDGRWLVVVDGEGRVQLTDLTNGETFTLAGKLHVIPRPDREPEKKGEFRIVRPPDVRISFCSDGEHLMGLTQVAGDKFEKDTISVWRLANAKIVKEMVVPERAHAFDLLEEGRILVTGAEEQLTGADVAFWDAATLKRLKEWKEPSPRLKKIAVRAVEAFHLSPDGSHLAVVVNDDVYARSWVGFHRSVRLWNLKTGEPGPSIPTFSPWAIAFSRDGKALACPTNERSVGLLDTTSGEKSKITGPAHREPIESLDFHPDGDTLLSASRDGAILRWDTATIRKHPWK